MRTPKLRETGFTFSTISHAVLWSVVSPRTALGQKQDFSCPVYFLAKHGTQLLAELYDAIHPECLDHQVIFPLDSKNM